MATLVCRGEAKRLTPEREEQMPVKTRPPMMWLGVLIVFYFGFALVVSFSKV